ncbi:MAG: (Fe-S)-binding protein, partial [Deltaproteobacteria bacterium]|nr:(Fe-S)-binding protein [Deltaproteobacteria bacterium]
EMENAKEDSNCCGMGGGRMWMEPPKGLLSSQVIAEKRVEQALDTKAEVLLTACPFCNITLSDAGKGRLNQSHGYYRAYLLIPSVSYDNFCVFFVCRPYCFHTFPDFFLDLCENF